MTSFTTDKVLLAVEGNSGVGKSTTSEAVARRLKAPWFPEPGSYIDPRLGESVPNFPGQDGAAAIKESSIWCAAELRRQADMARSEVSPRIADCTSISILAFELAKARFGHPHATSSLAAEYLRLYTSGTLDEPSHWLFLTAPPEIVLSRIENRGGSRPFLRSSETVLYLDAIRLHFAENYLTPDGLIWLDNNDRPLSMVVDTAEELLTQKTTPPAASPVCAFLTRMVHDPGYIPQLIELP